MLALPAFVLADCGQKSCTLIGCTSGTYITVKRTGGQALQPGGYSVTVQGLGIASCTVAADGSISTCASGDPTAQESAQSLTFFFPPGDRAEPAGSIDVAIARDGTQLLSMTEKVAIRPLFPNGPDCGGQCSQGNVEIEL